MRAADYTRQDLIGKIIHVRGKERYAQEITDVTPNGQYIKTKGYFSNRISFIARERLWEYDAYEPEHFRPMRQKALEVFVRLFPHRPGAGNAKLYARYESDGRALSWEEVITVDILEAALVAAEVSV